MVAKEIDMEEEAIKNLVFNPSRDIFEGNVRLFGFTIRQQGPKLIIIIKIYEESRRKEILDKIAIMVGIMINSVKYRGIDIIYVVDSKDILDQIARYKIDHSKFGEDLMQKQDVTIETVDIITGEYVPVEFSLGWMNDVN